MSLKLGIAFKNRTRRIENNLPESWAQTLELSFHQFFFFNFQFSVPNPQFSILNYQFSIHDPLLIKPRHVIRHYYQVVRPVVAIYHAVGQKSFGIES